MEVEINRSMFETGEITRKLEIVKELILTKFITENNEDT